MYKMWKKEHEMSPADMMILKFNTSADFDIPQTKK
jgi:hypothetical protein